MHSLYPYNNPPQQWSWWNPRNKSDIGIVDNPSRFSPAHVEQHLFRVDDPIEELEKMFGWLQRAMNESAETSAETGADVDMRLFEAIGYIQARHQNIRGDRALREEAGGVYDELNEEDADAMDTSSSLSSPYSADNDDMMRLMIDHIGHLQRAEERHGEGSSAREGQ